MKINLKGNTSQATLPSGYTAVDYIQSSGTQYIDTGYTFTSTKEKIDFKYSPLVIENARVCGSYVSAHRGMIIQPRQQDMAEVGALSITPTFSINANTDYKVILEANNGNYNFVFGDNSQTGTYTSTPITNRSHYIFAVNFTGTATKATMKLYYYKMYDNDVLVRNFVPCYRNSDNEVGLYDLVNNVFYTNAGTGAFTYGSTSVSLPSPDFPIPINVVSGDNSIDVCGKNLFKLTPYSDRGITFEENNDGTIKISGTATTTYCSVPNNKRTNCNLGAGTYTFSKTEETTARVGISLWYEDGTSESRTIVSGTSLTFATTKRIVQYGAYLSGLTANTSYNYNIGIQLEKNEEKTSFEPYQGASYPINLGDIELCKIGDYQDSIVKDNGKWYLNKQIGKVVLNGSETYSSQTTYYTIAFSQISPRPRNSSALITNYFKNTGEYQSGGIWAGSGGLAFNKNGLPSTITDTTSFKSWLSTHNTIVYYVLNTPTNTEITDSTLLSQLEALNGARSYITQTNINQVNNDNASILNASALSE